TDTSGKGTGSYLRALRIQEPCAVKSALHIRHDLIDFFSRIPKTLNFGGRILHRTDTTKPLSNSGTRRPTNNNTTPPKNPGCTTDDHVTKIATVLRTLFSEGNT